MQTEAVKPARPEYVTATCSRLWRLAAEVIGLSFEQVKEGRFRPRMTEQYKSYFRLFLDHTDYWEAYEFAATSLEDAWFQAESFKVPVIPQFACHSVGPGRMGKGWDLLLWTQKRFEPLETLHNNLAPDGMNHCVRSVLTVDESAQWVYGWASDEQGLQTALLRFVCAALAIEVANPQSWPPKTQPATGTGAAASVATVEGVLP